ncbi:hypothetical protein BBJ28_00004200 [Nothophytophthora sp. Chile5]|nr:hypothetical protein BBJ28_00004200 [Nothophytophthora sp. Chile5]
MLPTYNKTNTKGALIGNWIEEDALRDKTGFARRKVPAPLFAPAAGESCNSHASAIVPPPFETTLQASTRYSDHAVEKLGPGPRGSLRDMQLMETARHLHDQQRALERQQEEREHQSAALSTVTKSSFQPLATSALLGTTRVPRGRNGSLARAVDSSIQHLTKAQVDSIDQMKLDLLQGAAVTRYSYAVTTGVGLDFPTTASDASNVFGRLSTFTNQIGDPSKRHAEAMEPGSDHDERLGASVHQRSALKRLLHLLKSDPDMARRFTDALRREAVEIPEQQRSGQPQQEEEYGYIQLGHFRAAFSTVGAVTLAAGVVRGLPVLLTDKEVIHIFMYFDADNIGVIRLAPFLDYCTSLGEKAPYHSQYNA